MNMKKAIIPVILFLSIFMIGCSSSKDSNKGEESVNNSMSNEEIGDEAASNDNSSEETVNNDNSANTNTTTLINTNSSQSNNKLALVCKDVYVSNSNSDATVLFTINSTDIDVSNFGWVAGGIGNETISFDNADSGLDYEFSLNGLNLELAAEEYDASAEYLADDGDWLLKGSTYDSNSTYYTACMRLKPADALDDAGTAYLLVEISMGSIDTLEEAKEIYNHFKEIFSAYVVNDNNYLEVMNSKNETVDLSDYTFLNDIIANMLAENNLNIVSSEFFKGIDLEEICIYVPLNDDFIEYTIEYDRFLENNDIGDVEDTFTMNNKTISMIAGSYDSFKDFYVEKEEGFIIIESFVPDSEAEKSKELFISNFN